MFSYSTNCDICYSNINNNNTINCYECKSSVCKECYIRYIETRIENNDINNITSICCSRYINDRFISVYTGINMHNERLKLIDKLKKYYNCKCCGERLQLNNKRYRFYYICKQKKCSKFNNKICIGCDKPFHFFHRCDNQNSTEIIKKIKKRIIKPCPGCYTLIEKNEGCNHICCSVCKKDFCWVCRKDFDVNNINVDTNHNHITHFLCCVIKWI